MSESGYTGCFRIDGNNRTRKESNNFQILEFTFTSGIDIAIFH